MPKRAIGQHGPDIPRDGISCSVCGTVDSWRDRWLRLESGEVACKRCHGRDRYHRTPKKTISDRHYRYKLGISLSAAEALLNQQGSVCAICAHALRGLGRTSGMGMIDHDHRNGRIRGVLCVSCNTAIGKLGDDYRIVLRAHDYLLRNQDDETVAH